MKRRSSRARARSRTALVGRGDRSGAADPIERASSRPDFLVLGYPVISFDPAITHAGSVRNLLGEWRLIQQSRVPL